MTSSRGSLAAAIGGTLISFAILSAGTAALAQRNCHAPPPPAPVRADIAVSLTRLEAELSRCQRTASCTPQTLTWYGMTRVAGYVVDSANHDIVLFGTHDPTAAPLRVDDFVVALRNTTHKYVEHKGAILVYSDPAVTIDPDPIVLHKLDHIMAVSGGGAAERDRRLEAWCATCELPQTVRLMGLGADSDSHFGFTMFSGDLLMKHISNGTAPIDGLESLSDLAMRMAIARTTGHSEQSGEQAELNRFWFYPGATEYLEDGTTVVLARAEVILRTEAEQVTGNARVAASGRADPLAARFACAFSKMYPDLAAADTRYPIYAELRALFRWVGLARVLEDDGAFETAGYRPDFLLGGFTVPRVSVPHTVKGVAHVGKWDHVEDDGNTRTESSLRLPSCGGVTNIFRLRRRGQRV